MIRSLMKLAVGYAVTRALAKSGGPAGLLKSLFSSGSNSSGYDRRTNRGILRTPRQKRADARGRH